MYLAPGDHNSRVISGDIFYDGASLLGLSEGEWGKLRGARFSMIFQDSGAMMNPVRKIGSQFVEYIRRHQNCSKKEAWERAVGMLDRMNLVNPERIMRSYAFELSGGMRQRVGIALAMTFRPDILFADEPTSALDVTSQAEIVRQMIELRDSFGTGIVLVTHNLAVASYMCDTIAVMKNGICVEQGPSHQLIDNPQEEYTRSLIACVPELE